MAAMWLTFIDYSAAMLIAVTSSIDYLHGRRRGRRVANIHLTIRTAIYYMKKIVPSPNTSSAQGLYGHGNADPAASHAWDGTVDQRVGVQEVQVQIPRAVM